MMAASNMNEDFIKELFREFDSNNDGTLTRLEAEQAARSFGINNVRGFLNCFHCDYDGSITLDEFASKIKQLWIEEMNTEAFQKLFKHVDQDGSGALDEKEIKRMLDVLNIKISDDDLKKFIKAADMNNDGQIDTKEYIQFLKSIFKKGSVSS